MRLDSLQAVAVFVRVAELGSFTGAAQRLGMSPSGVSKSLSRLESKLGCRLVTRTTRSVHLTDEGRTLLDQYRQILNEVDQAEVLLTQRLAKPSGRLRLQLPVGFGRRVVLPLILRLTRDFPDLAVDMEFSERSADPAEEGLDAAIRIGEPGDTRLVARKLCDIRFLAVASPAYLRRHGEPASPGDLQAHECLSYFVPQTGRYRDWEFRAPDGTLIVKSFPGRVNVNNAQALMHAAIEGAGIALVANFIAADAIRAGQLQMILRDYVSTGPSIWLLYGERRYQLPRVRALIELLMAEIPNALQQISPELLAARSVSSRRIHAHSAD